MKKYIISLISGLALLSGCTKSAVSPLSEDRYPKPKTYTLTQVETIDRTKDENGKFHFPLSLSSSEGDKLSLVMIADTYYLPSKTFSGSTADLAKSGNYIAEESSFCPAGGNLSPLNTTGTVSVIRNEDHYTLAGYLWTADEKAFRVEAAFDAHFEPEAEPVKFPKLLVAKSGEGSVNVVFSTDGVTATPNMYGGVDYKGTGNYISLDIYSPDGKLYPGIYEPSTAGGYITEGKFGIAFESEYEYMPGAIVKLELGSRYYTLDNDNSSNVGLTDGTVKVEKTGSTYTISYKNGDIWVAYTGAVEALDYEAMEYVALTKAVQVAQTGANTLTLRLASDGVSAEWMESYQYYVFSGTGNYLVLEIYTADGSLKAGTYKACETERTVNEGEFGTGYSWDYEYSPGMSYTIKGGSTWYTLNNGAETSEFVKDGIVTVSYQGDECNIVLESTTANAKFTGKLTE